MRVLLTTRQGTVVARTKAICQLKALLVGAPQQLRQHFRGMTTDQQLERCTRLRTVPSHSAEHRATVRALRISARQALFLEAQAADLETELEELVLDAAPALLEQPGVGVVSAAQIIISWSHPRRLRSEAAFASLAGAAPIPASSGQITRHRLNHSGDRQLNRALHTIVLSRLQHHAPTRAYAARRTAEGKTARDIKRCLKRAVARQVFRLLESTAPPQDAGDPQPDDRAQPHVSAAPGSDATPPPPACSRSPRLDPVLPHDQHAQQRGRPPLSTPQASDLKNHVPRGLVRDLPRPTPTS
ncbi:transposase [Streptomyces sp. NPDC001530]|uniref:transposase n=1 Tax=Streptomyces sp. NPDC001530 TaxID=3364582 RepID=UPI0036CAE0FA